MELRAADKAQTGTGATTTPDWHSQAAASLVLVTQWLFLLTVAILPLDIYLSLPGAQNGVFLSQVLTVEASASLIVTLLVARALGVASGLRLTYQDLIPLGLVVMAAALSLVFATSRSVALKGGLKVLCFLGIYVLARAFRDIEGVRRHALLLMLGGFVIVLLSGLLGYTNGLPDISGILLNIHRTSAAIPYSSVVRAESTFRYPNELAAYLLIMLPILVGCVVSYRQRLERWAGILILVWGIYLLVVTYTRGALVALAVTLPILLYLLAGRRLALVGVVAIALGAGLVAIKGGVLSSRIFSVLSLQTLGYGERLSAWKWAWDAFIHHPLFGVGIDNLALQPNAPISNQALGLPETDAENLLLNVLAEMGVFGLAAVLYCFAGAFRLVWKARQASLSWVDRAWNNGLFVALCALLVFGLGDPVLVSAQVTGLLLATVGLAGVSRSVEEPLLSPSHRLSVAETLGVLNARIAAAKKVPALRSKIVFLLNTTPDDVSALGLVELATELWRLGASVLVVVPTQSSLMPLLESKGVPCLGTELGLNLEGRRGWRGTLAYLISASRRSRANLVHSLTADGPTILICPYLREQLDVQSWAGNGDSRSLWVLLSSPAVPGQSALLGRRWAKRAREADGVVAFSPRAAEEAVKLGIPAQRLQVMADVALEELPGESTTVVRLPELIAVVSPLRESQGIQYVIQALPRVCERHPQARLTIAGTGPFETALRQQVHELGLEHRVRFLGAISDPRWLLRQASLLVYPAVDPVENLPEIILEAFAVGTPVVASAIGSVPKLVAHRRTGLLALPGDVASLTQAITALFDDSIRAETIGRAGREIARYLQLGKNGGRFLQLLVEMHATRQAGTRSTDQRRTPDQISPLQRRTEDV